MTDIRDRIAVKRAADRIAAPALTLLRNAGLEVTDSGAGDGSYKVDNAALFWPQSGYWRSLWNDSFRGYGVRNLIIAVAPVQAVRA